jgi:probable addiction module antidote protein
MTAKTKILLKPFDVAAHLQTNEDIAAYLEAVFADGDTDEIRDALGHVARARGMTGVAEKAGITRSAAYKALGDNGNPSFATISALLAAIDLRLTVKRVAPHGS